MLNPFLRNQIRNNLSGPRPGLLAVLHTKVRYISAYLSHSGSIRLAVLEPKMGSVSLIYLTELAGELYGLSVLLHVLLVMGRVPELPVHQEILS
jgi:hypothetical protein